MEGVRRGRGNSQRELSEDVSPPQGRPEAPRQLLGSWYAKMLELAFHKSGKPWEGLERSCTKVMRWPCPHLFCSCGEPSKGKQLMVYCLRREKANRVRPEISGLEMERVLTTADDVGLLCMLCMMMWPGVAGQGSASDSLPLRRTHTGAGVGKVYVSCSGNNV